MSLSPFLEQKIHKINVLILEDRFNEAYKILQDLLLQFPENIELLKLQQKIEFTAKEKNEKMVENRLRELKPLWHKEEYSTILRKLKDLKKYSPNNSKINKNYKKAQELYKNQIEESQKEFHQNQKQELDDLLNNNPDQLIAELFYLERNNIGNLEIQKLAKNYKNKLIDKKIKEQKDLLRSNKFEVINSFIEQLKRIDETNPQIPQLIKQLQQNKHNHQLEEKRDFVFNGIKHLKTLIKLKKYSKAVKTGEEIINLSPKNKTIEKLLKKAEKLLYLQTRELTISSMINSEAERKADFQKNPQNYIKI